MSGYGSLQSQGGTGVSAAPSGATSQDFTDQYELITAHIYQINNATNTLSKSMAIIGTKKDTQHFRDQVRQRTAQINDVIKETSNSIKQLEKKFARDRSRRLQVDRISIDFKSATDNNVEVQKKLLNSLRVSLNMAADTQLLGSHEMSREDATNEVTVEIYAQLQERQQTLEVDAALIAEREERIGQLEQDMGMINEIMRDMADMVHEQGDIIDDIEANVDNTQHHVEEANVNLIQAKRYQSKSRKKMCILALILVVVVGVLVLIVGLSLRN